MSGHGSPYKSLLPHATDLKSIVSVNNAVEFSIQKTCRVAMQMSIDFNLNHHQFSFPPAWGFKYRDSKQFQICAKKRKFENCRTFIMRFHLQNRFLRQNNYMTITDCLIETDKNMFSILKLIRNFTAYFKVEPKGI